MKIKNKVKDMNKYIMLIVVSLILAGVIEFILVESNTFSKFAVGNILAISGICIFIGLHFIKGFKNLYNYIIDNRYIISIVLIILSTIIGFMQNSINLKDWLIARNIPLSLWWNIKFFAIILASFELMLIITNNRSISAVGSILISISGAIQWNFECINAIIIGEIIVVLLNNLINSSKNKIIYASIIAILGFCYMQTTLTVAIAFSYIWLALIIWILIKNKEKISENKIILIITFLVTTILAVISMKLVKTTYQTDFIEDYKGASFLFTYIYNIVLPFISMENKYLYGNFLSLFPIPMLISLYYLYKNDDKHIQFLFPITVVTILETVFCISGFPSVVNQIIGFNKVNVVRMSIAVNYANLLILLYIISNIDEIFRLKTAMKLTLVSVCLLAFIGYPNELTSRNYVYFWAAELCTLFLMFYNYGNKKYRKVLLIFMVLLTLISGIFVNPVVKDKTKNIAVSMEEKYEK